MTTSGSQDSAAPAAAGGWRLRLGTGACLAAAFAFGAVSLAAQTLLLRRFLWRVEAAEAGVALFLSCWLLWTGAGAAAAASGPGRRLVGWLARAPWLPALACAALYFVQYALLAPLRGWLGLPAYERFALPHLALVCLLANAPLCFAAGFAVPALCRRLAGLGQPAARAFAWEALGAAAGGLGLTLLLARGVAPDPRDEAEWRRFFPQAAERPQRLEAGGGTTFFGSCGGTFYALSSGGVSDVLPEGDRAAELAALLLSQRPYAKSALLLGRAPLAAGAALARFRPDLAVTWCPCDAAYGVRVLQAAQARGLVGTNVCAAGTTPQALLASLPAGAFDAVLVAPPPAASLEGAAWRQEEFARRVRRVTRRTGAALFGLDCEAVTLTPERLALLGETVRGVRRAWPESGALAAGAGGWWVAAQVPRLAYGADDAAARWAMLKRDDFAPQAILLLYDPARAEQWACACPALSPEQAELAPPTGDGLRQTLAAGAADALRRAYPAAAPGKWLARLQGAGARLVGLALVALWMAPVALGAARGAQRRLVAAWLGACGALGLVASLCVLYRLQLDFGSLYLLAGAGSCLYLAGLFCGNRLADAAAALAQGRQAPLLAAALASSLALAALALLAAAGLPHAATAAGRIAWCWALGCAAGAAVPVALALAGEDGADAAPLFVLADAAGAALGGLAFLALVPLAGLAQAAGCFAVLAVGLALCVAAAGGHARLTAGLALVVALALLGGRVNLLLEQAGGAPAQALEAAEAGRPPAEATGERAELPGIPRRLDLPRVREQLQRGQLATNAAAYWE